MKQRIISKTLAVAVIVLFVGVGVQPAFADVSNISISNSEDDCDICPKISNMRFGRTVSVKDLLEISDDLWNKFIIRLDVYICIVLQILFLRYVLPFIFLHISYLKSIFEILWFKNWVMLNFFIAPAVKLDCSWLDDFGWEYLKKINPIL